MIGLRRWWHSTALRRLASSRYAAGAVLAGWLLLGCAPPKQYGGLMPIDQAGVAQRLRVLCLLGVGPDIADETCQPAEAPVAADSIVRSVAGPPAVAPAVESSPVSPASAASVRDTARVIPP